MLQSTDSSAGYLFGVRASRAVLLAALPDIGAEVDMCDWVDECLKSSLGADELATAAVTADETLSSGTLRYTDNEGHVLEPVFMIAPRDGASEIAAVLVLRAPSIGRGAKSRTSMPLRLIQELARELLEHGDVGGMPAGAAAP
jgi:hypothetical protein